MDNECSNVIIDEKNSIIYAESLNNAFEKIQDCLDLKVHQRSNISNEISNLIENENCLFENKNTLNDMILLFQEYGYKPEFYESIISNRLPNHKDCFYDLIRIIKNIEEITFINLYDRDVKLEEQKSADELLKISVFELEKLKIKFEILKKSSVDDSNSQVTDILVKIIEDKLSIVEEQNKMINTFLLFFLNMKDELIKSCGKIDDENENTNPTGATFNDQRLHKVSSKFASSENEKNQSKFQDYCKAMIVKCFEESLGLEEKEEVFSTKKNKPKKFPQMKNFKRQEGNKNKNLFTDQVTEFSIDDLIILSQYEDK